MGETKLEKEWKSTGKEKKKEEGKWVYSFLFAKCIRYHAVARREELAEKNALYGAQADGEG
jgi:hypothetical protein